MATVFDIRLPRDREALAEEGHDAAAGLLSHAIRVGLDALVRHLGPRSWMEYRFGAFSVPVGRGLLSLGLAEAVRLGSQLEAVSGCANFSAALVGFSNPTQFQASVFELEMARWCLERRAVSRLRFAPRYHVMGHDRVAEFELSTPLGPLACECKRPNLPDTTIVARMTSLTDAFDKVLQGASLDANIRLEVEQVAVVKGNLDAIVTDAFRAAVEAPLESAVECGPFRVLRSQIGSPPLLSKLWHVKQGRVRVGSTVVGIAEQYTYLLVSSPQIERALHKMVGMQLNAAHRQLPHNKPGVIFVECPPVFGIEAAKRRMTAPEFRHVVAVVVAHAEGVDIQCRPHHRTAINWVLGGETPGYMDGLTEIIRWRLRRW